MPTSESKIPNLPLNGQELKEVVISNADELIGSAHENALLALRGRMDADGVFGKTYTHPRVRITMALRFHFSNQHMPETKFEVGTGEKPHSDSEATHHVEAVTREIEIQNPNLERLAAGVAFKQIDVERPKPGELIGVVKETEIPVDKNDYPKPNAPVDTDTSDAAAASLGIPEERRIGKKKRGKP